MRSFKLRSRTFGLRVILLTSLLLPTNIAAAMVSVTAHSGGAYSLLDKADGEPLKGAGYTLGASFLWQPGNGQRLSPFVLGLLARQTKISYVENSIRKRATYLAIGPEIGLYKSFSDSIGLYALITYSPSPNFTTIGSNSILLNNEIFHYSTWQNLKGSEALGARIAFMHDKVTGQFSKKNRFRSGVSLSYQTQTLTRSTTEVTGSKGALAPSISSTTESTDYKFYLYTLDLFLGISF